MGWREKEGESDEEAEEVQRVAFRCKVCYKRQEIRLSNKSRLTERERERARERERNWEKEALSLIAMVHFLLSQFICTIQSVRSIGREKKLQQSSITVDKKK